MSGMLEEATITCPWCWEQVVLIVETSADTQQYIEACQVCCNPIEISVTCDDGILHGVEAERGE